MNNIEKLAIEHINHPVKEINEGESIFIDSRYWGVADEKHFIFSLTDLVAFAKALQSSEPVAKQPWPNHNWCVGCDPDNCSGCGTEPNERRKQATVPLEKYNKLLDALRFYADKNHVNFGDDLNKNFPNVFAMKYVPISGGEYPSCIENGEVARQAIAEAEGKEG